MRRTVIALGRFEEAGKRIAEFLGADSMPYAPDAFRQAFHQSSHIVAVMSTGIATRSIAPLISDKWKDPAVVVVDPGFSFAIPLVGGHHGANDLARELSGLGLTPVITTATERAGRSSAEAIAREHGSRIMNQESTVRVNAAILDGDVPFYSIAGPSMILAGPETAIMVREGEYSVGLGCRKGTGEDAVVDALRKALSAADISADEVSVFATTVKKFHEPGILGAVRALGGILVYLDDSILAQFPPESPSRAGAVGLAGVAEPAARAASRRKELVMKKTVFGEVTVAIAR